MEGLEKSDTKTVVVEAKDAYGDINPEAVQKVGMDQFPENIKPEVGMQLMAQTQTAEVPVTITEVSDEYVMVDFNHPLARKKLIFDVEIVSVK